VFVNNTAAATLRQLVIYIFEKVGDEDIAKQKSGNKSDHPHLNRQGGCIMLTGASFFFLMWTSPSFLFIAASESQTQAKSEIKDQVESTQENEEQLGPCALDAYLLFQDLCLLTNSEQARFLNLGSISRTFGLELIESVLTNHFHLFKQVRHS
jgi:hypothetical protein